VLLQTTAPSDPRLVAEAVRRGLRPLLFTARGLGWTVIGLAMVLEVVTGGGLNLTLLLAGALVAVGIPMALVNNGTRQAMLDGELATYEISDGGVARSSTESRHAYAWSAFRFVEEMSGQLVFGGGRSRIVTVPTTGLSPADISQILGTAAGHGLRVRRA
jgi:hypothetical protein